MMSKRSFLFGSLAAIGALGAARARSAAPAAPEGAVFEITRSEEEWRRLLTPAQFSILRDHGTERAGSSPLNNEHRQGAYLCAGCGLPVFSSKTKYDSGTGWPSFWAPLPDSIGTSEDRGLFMVRTEVHCRRCGGHFGHVFDDGPPPTGLRYCLNGAALAFVPE